MIEALQARIIAKQNLPSANIEAVLGYVDHEVKSRAKFGSMSMTISMRDYGELSKETKRYFIDTWQKLGYKCEWVGEWLTLNWSSAI